MEEYIDKKEVMLKTLHDVKGSEQFRMAMIHFLVFEKKMVHNGFLPIELLTSKSTAEEINKALENLTKEAGAESDELDKVRKAQKEYADMNGFRIEETSQK